MNHKFDIRTELEMPNAVSRIVGLLGGSFDPPHSGHVHISNLALRLLDLDEIWWLISPGNPLKVAKPASYNQRYEKAQTLIRNPKIKVSEFEYLYGITHSCETILKLKQKYSNHCFIWLMGSDNLVQISQWKEWRWIFENITIVVLSRAGFDIPGLASRAAKTYSKYYLPSCNSNHIVFQEPPAWTLIKTPIKDISSTKFRKMGLWNSKGCSTSKQPQKL